MSDDKRTLSECGLHAALCLKEVQLARAEKATWYERYNYAGAMLERATWREKLANARSEGRITEQQYLDIVRGDFDRGNFRLEGTP